MIDGEACGPILFSFGALIIGIWAFLVTVLQINLGILLLVGFSVSILGPIIHIGSEIHYEYQKRRNIK